MWRTSSLKVLPFAQKVEAGIIDWTILSADPNWQVPYISATEPMVEITTHNSLILRYALSETQINRRRLGSTEAL
jgi:hypothetical protein